MTVVLAPLLLKMFSFVGQLHGHSKDDARKEDLLMAKLLVTLAKAFSGAWWRTIPNQSEMKGNVNRLLMLNTPILLILFSIHFCVFEIHKNCG